MVFIWYLLPANSECVSLILVVSFPSYDWILLTGKNFTTAFCCSHL